MHGTDVVEQLAIEHDITLIGRRLIRADPVIRAIGTCVERKTFGLMLVLARTDIAARVLAVEVEQLEPRAIALELVGDQQMPERDVAEDRFDDMPLTPRPPIRPRTARKSASR
jgi:hypothetical protein